jgi:hypothetical protein
MENGQGRRLKTLEKAAAAFVLLGAVATLAYAFGESWIG